MPENASFSGCLDRIELDFVEREVTPRLLMKLNIQLHLAELSLLNTIYTLEISGVERDDLPFTTGFIKPIYSPKKVEAQITLRLMKR
jgi:hypothetical protein